jgi:sodium/bile acid cotransporter 7
MTGRMPRSGFRHDSFTIAIALTVGVAFALPCHGLGARIFGLVTDLAIATLFFLHGARLSRATVVAGLSHWRLHLLVLGATFGMFPLLGLLIQPVSSTLLPGELQAGLLFLCAVPSTVQSSIALTAMARGNVAAAVCSASLSSMLGVAFTPLLVELLGLRAGGNVPMGDALRGLTVQLLLPFAIGQLLRGRLELWVERHKSKLRFVDQGSILLAVYTAFSAAMVQGVWRELPLASLGFVLLFVSALLASALLLTWRASRFLGFSRADEIVVVFCGSKKSLASGVPIANVLFPAALAGTLVLPLMLYHQLQLIVCTLLAQRYGAATDAAIDAKSPVH